MTELIWDGKYDKDGKKTAPIRIALPFQNIETVNESTEDRKKVLDMFAQGRETEWRNRLIWGDKKYVLPSLMPEFAGKVNLIYIDPPFDTGADFSFTAQIPDNPDTDEYEATSFTKEASIIEQKAYRDTWGRGLDSYLQWFYETAILLRDLLTDDGSIYVHLDWHVGHYAKTILDEVFGYDRFINELVWKRTFNTGSSKGQAKKFPVSTDIILWYSKSQTYRYNTQYRPYTEDYIKHYYIYDDKDGRGPYQTQALATYSEERLKQLKAENRIVPGKGKVLRFKDYLKDKPGVVISNIWDDLEPVNPIAGEKLGYNTQKPETLLNRILSTSTSENDLILDCFCGSGTTAAVAEKLNRRWITCDLGRFAIHTARKRLLGIPGVKPFNVQNLGKYERQQWAQAEFPTASAERAAAELTYRNFILELYHGQPISGYTWLHGTKAGRMVHVGAVDSPVAIGDIKQIVQEFWKTAGKSKDLKTNGVDVLGWDFAFDINETAKQIAAEHNIDLKTKKIPREVLEKKAVEQGDIKFYELAFLNVKQKVVKKKLTLELKDFIVPPDDVPEEVAGHISHWSQWIDYWAVDWEHKDDTFHNQWQSYRTKKSPKIDLKVDHEYEQGGKYQVVVKVIDILGNDTTKQMEVTV